MLLRRSAIIKQRFAVSAGNTGALMAVSRLILRTLPGIDRPALAGQWPTIHRPSIVLDVGANIGASAQELCYFALMGAAMAQSVFGIERPTVGLLNVGTEEIKGADEVKQAHAWLKDVQLSFDYRGYVEGDKIGQGVVDVVVCEGFTGNIALKTAEGTAKQIATYLREAMTSSLLSKAGAVLASGAFKILRDRADPRRSNGGTFLGLKRHRDQKSRRHRRIRFCQRHRGRLWDGRQRNIGTAHRRPCRPTGQAWADRFECRRRKRTREGRQRVVNTERQHLKSLNLQSTKDVLMKQVHHAAASPKPEMPPPAPPKPELPSPPDAPTPEMPKPEMPKPETP